VRLLLLLVRVLVVRLEVVTGSVVTRFSNFHLAKLLLLWLLLLMW
jgi:hypothetical protein